MSTTINTKVYIKPGQQVRRFKLSSDDTTFESFKQSVLQAYEASPLKHTVGVEYETQFLYLDDEDDWISMNTEQEFRDALSFVGSNAIFRVKVVVLPKNRPEQQHQHQHPHHRPQHCRPQHPRCFRAPQPHHVINLGDLVESLFKPAAEQKKEEPQKKQAEQQEQKKPAEQSTQLLDNLLDELFQPNTSTTTENNNNRTESVQDPLSGLLQGVFGSLNQQGTQQAVPFQAALNSLFQQTTNNNGADPLSGLLNGLFNTVQQHVRQPEPQKTEEPKQEVVQKQPEQQPEVKVEEKTVEVPIQQEEELVIVDEPQVVQKEEPVQQEEQLQEQPEPQPFEQELQSLESMGFTNHALNLHLLKHHNGDLIKVVSQLLELSH